jgi:hypothetical protein
MSYRTGHDENGARFFEYIYNLYPYMAFASFTLFLHNDLGGDLSSHHCRIKKHHIYVFYIRKLLEMSSLAKHQT